MELPALLFLLAALIIGLLWLASHRRRNLAGSPPACRPAIRDAEAPPWAFPADQPEPGWEYCQLICTPVGEDRWLVCVRRYTLDGLTGQEKHPDYVDGRSVIGHRRRLAAQGWQEVLATQDGARLICAYRRRA